MADISLVVEVLGEESLDRAMTATNKLERGINKLSKSFQQGKLTESQLRTGLNQLAKSSATVGRTYQNNLKITKRYEGQILRTARSLDVLERETIGADAAQKRYNVTLANGGRAVNQFGVQASRSQVKMKRFGSVGLQQVGYQVQDFAVQLQGGTNAAVAFGQQGSQLLGIFGAGGALAGAALAITTAFIAPLLDARKAAKDLDKGMEDLTKSVGDYTSALSKSKQSISDLRSEYGMFARDAQNLNDINTKLVRTIAQRELATGVNKLSNSFGGQDFGLLPQGELDRIALGKQSYEDLLDVLVSVAETSVDASNNALDFNDALEEQRENSLEAVVQLERLKDQLDEQSAKWGISKDAVAGFLANVIRLKDAENYEERNAALKQMAEYLDDATDGFTNGTDEAFELYIQILKAADAALVLGDNADRAAEKFAQINATGFGNDLFQLPGEGASRDVQEQRIQELKDAWAEFNKKGGTESGSDKTDQTSNLDKFREKLTLQERLRNQTEVEMELIKALKDEYSNLDQSVIEGLRQRVQAEISYQEELKQQQDILKSIESASDTFFNSLVDGTITVKDAFKDMARSILADLWDIFVTKKITGFILDAVSGAMGAPTASAPTSSPTPMARPTRFASGGIVGSPTLFPMADGMGLMGEAGPEAIMPLKRGKDGKLYAIEAWQRW
jgi:archaellum component FlaC